MHSLSILSAVLLLAGTSPQPSRPPSGDDVQIRINGPVHVAATDTAASVWVVNHDATVDGVVRNGLGVVNGTARISGKVEGGVVVVNGRLELLPGARIDHDVMLYRSTMTRANDAIVAGAVHDQTGFSIGAGAIWLVWLSFTIVVVLAGILFAELAPVTLADSARHLTEHTGQSLLTALVVTIAVPTLATLSFITVVGIPLGLTLLFIVIPALTFLGYLVAGFALGSAMGTPLTTPGERRDRYVRAVAGLVTLQIVTALPVLGGLVGFVASLVGVGALVARGWARRERRLSAPALAPAHA